MADKGPLPFICLPVQSMTDKYAGAVRPAAPPAEPLPPLSCDCHLHVFGDPAKFPDRNANPVHPSREASWEDALRMHRSVGFGRGVFVQPANYTTDHSYLLEALARVPRGRYRATGIIDDTRRARPRSSACMPPACAACGSISCACSRWRRARRRSRARSTRSSQFGWYIKIFIGPEELPDYFESLRKITAVPVVIDHMARLKPGAAPSHTRHGD